MGCKNKEASDRRWFVVRLLRVRFRMPGSRPKECRDDLIGYRFPVRIRLSEDRVIYSPIRWAFTVIAVLKAIRRVEGGSCSAEPRDDWSRRRPRLAEPKPSAPCGFFWGMKESGPV